MSVCVLYGTLLEMQDCVLEQQDRNSAEIGKVGKRRENGTPSYRPLLVNPAKLNRSQSPPDRNPPATSFKPLTLNPPPF